WKTREAKISGPLRRHNRESVLIVVLRRDGYLRAARWAVAHSQSAVPRGSEEAGSNPASPPGFLAPGVAHVGATMPREQAIESESTVVLPEDVDACLRVLARLADEPMLATEVHSLGKAVARAYKRVRKER